MKNTITEPKCIQLESETEKEESENESDNVGNSMKLLQPHYPGGLRGTGKIPIGLEIQ